MMSLRLALLCLCCVACASISKNGKEGNRCSVFIPKETVLSLNDSKKDKKFLDERKEEIKGKLEKWEGDVAAHEAAFNAIRAAAEEHNKKCALDVVKPEDMSACNKKAEEGNNKAEALLEEGAVLAEKGREIKREADRFGVLDAGFTERRLKLLENITFLLEGHGCL